MSRYLLSAIIALVLAGCATHESTIQKTQLDRLRAMSRGGDAHAAADAGMAIAFGGQVAGKLSEAMRFAKQAAAAKVPEGRALFARLLESSLDVKKAYDLYLALAEDPESPLLMRQFALHKIHALIDTIPLREVDVKRLCTLAKNSGLVGEIAAFAAEKAAIRVGSMSLLMQARNAVGGIRSYRRSRRLSSLPSLELSSAVLGDRPKEQLALKLGPSQPSVDGTLSFGESGSGTYEARIPLSASKSPRYMRLEKTEHLIVYFNRKELARFDGLGGTGPHVARVNLPPGASGFIRLIIGSRAPDPHIRVSIHSGKSQSIKPGKTSALGTLALLDLALADGDVNRATDAFLRYPTLPSLAALSLLKLMNLDPALDIGEQGGSERAILHYAATRAPELEELRVALVRLLIDAGELRLAEALLKKMEPAPLELRLVQAIENQDQRAADELSRTLLEQRPSSCRAQTLFFSVHDERLRLDASSWFSTLPFCPAVQLKAAEILKTGWRNRDAIALLRGHIARTPVGIEKARAMLLMGETYRQVGDNETAEKTFRLGAQMNMLATEFWDAVSRLRILARDPVEAAAINAKLVTKGASDPGFTRSRLDPRLDLGLPLKDGFTVAREALSRRHEAIAEGKAQPSMRILLKERHTRVLKDGSQVHRAHQILELLDNGALERFGELPLPADAQVLVARTYKPTPDGRLQPIEPEQIPEKTSLSLPALTVGSIIEAAWTWQTPPPTRQGTHWVLEPFFFDSYSGPVREARLTIRTTPNSTYQVKSYGRTPRKETLENGLTRYTLEGCRRALKEPLNPRPMLHRNGLTATSGFSLRDVQRVMVDLMAENRRLIPSVLGWAKRLVKGKDTPKERLKALYHGVIKHVLDDAIHVFSTSVAQALKNRAGDRSVVLSVLCQAVGIRCELVMLQPRHNGPVNGDELETFDQYDYPVVRARLPTGDVWLDPNFDFAPFGYLMPVLRHAPGIVLEDDEATLIRSPRSNTGDGLRRIMCKGVVAHDQHINIDCHEHITGLAALSRRTKLSPVDTAARNRYVSNIARRIFPGGKIHSVSFLGLEKQSAALEIRWKADVPYRHLHEKNMQLLVGLSPALLTRMSVKLPRRKTPLFIQANMNVEFQLDLTTEGLYRFELDSETRTVDHALVQFERRLLVGAKKQTLTVQKRFHIDSDHILPQDYQRWVDTARRIDNLERLRIIIEK
jgi:hypothetical protein